MKLERRATIEAKYAALLVALTLGFLAVGTGFTSELSNSNNLHQSDQAQIQTLQSDLNTLGAQLQTTSSSNSATMSTQQALLQSLQNDLNLFKSQVQSGTSSSQSAITALQNDLTALKSQVQSGTSSSQSAITALQNDLSTLKGQFATGAYGNGFVGVSGNGLSGLEAASNIVANQVSTLQNKVSQLPMMNQNVTVRQVWLTWEKTPQADQDRFNPAMVMVNQGDTVDLTLISNDTVAHDVVIGAPYNIMINASMPGLYNDLTGNEFTTPALNNSPGVNVTGTPGNVTATYTFVAQYAGIYQYICTYHAQVGMFGYLIVMPNAAYVAPQSSGTTTTPKVTQIDILKGAAANPGNTLFSPATTVVVIGVNNTVEWSNNDISLHAFNAVDGSFISGVVSPAGDFTATFNTPGTYVYSCIFHPWMTGKIIVLEPGQHVTTTTTTTTTSTTTKTTTTTQSPGPTRIDIPNGAGSNTNSPGYAPATVTVVIGVNNTVIWTNNDVSPHTVSSTAKSFDSGNMSPGVSWTYVFTTPGTYTYYCLYHPWMKAQIIVKTG